MKKDLAVIFGLFLLIAFILIFGKGYSSGSFFTASQSTQSASVKKGYTVVKIRDLVVNAKLASNPNDRKKGLSKMDSLPIDSGMLFVFETSGDYAFWMKDMKFPIDIIWIDENKRIVSIVQYATPEPGRKDAELTQYKSNLNSKYVLEVNAGLTQRSNIQVGDTADFQL
ncbi:MAG TPA: DUF192 domain-containing protein [Candidatus Saccharimonadales bacterium]|nr:DUF192 domain-containing protein [Candidatus Saccharimonadales bacterium]